jgi:tripartite ATP-independent transporter DctM subunit
MVMGGIYFGVFTPTEASGIGAFGALVFAIARKRLSLQAFTISLFDTAKTTAMIFFIVAGAFIFGHFLVVTRFPDQLTSAIAGMEVNRYIIIAAFVTMYIFLGAFMDGMSMVLITVPILLPTIMALGFNPIWFGIIIVRMTEIGAITPPFGLNVFVIKGIAKDIPLSTIFRGIIPFLIADIFHVALLIAVPQLSLFLPGIMK